MFGLPVISSIPTLPSNSIINSIILSFLNIIVVYIATFVFHLSWIGVLAIMITMSIFTTFITNKFLAKLKIPYDIIPQEDHIMIITLVSSFCIFMILSYRFNYPMSLGIALLSGSLSTFIYSFINT
jgi:hypothetical protein